LAESVALPTLFNSAERNWRNVLQLNAFQMEPAQEIARKRRETLQRAISIANSLQTKI
jgi:hypothetical protein